MLIRAQPKLQKKENKTKQQIDPSNFRTEYR
jgi:hypothetical protein